MKKIISFSLWGNDPKYTIGAIENAKLAKIFYPEWIARFYVGTDVSNEIISSLKDENAEVISINEECGWTSTFWRFYAVTDPDVEIMISRDTDSRLGKREAEAVKEWISSPLLFHIMRDHPAHATEILAGMWGCKSPLFSFIESALETVPRIPNCKQADQIFLRQIYKYISPQALVHDPFFENKPFPTKREGADFVGQVYENAEPCSLFADDLMKDPRSKNT